MIVEKCHIEGLLILTPRIFEDERGAFFESFNQSDFDEFVGEKVVFVQDNQSTSKKNVLRGLHFQNPPYAQGKLVRVIQGSVLDVAVDIRKNSSTYGKAFQLEISAQNAKQLWIPPGFAHGFLALEDDTVFAYKCTNYYNPTAEDSLRWDDTDLGVDWNVLQAIISEKDKQAKLFSTFVSPF